MSDANQFRLRRMLLSFVCAAIAAGLTFPAGSAGHCSAGDAGCTIFPVNVVGFPTTEWISIPFGLVVGILVFVIIGWWRKFSNSPG
jgi:hypothetical protein